jgi:uncharacterized RDD family membrane protein YckC
MKNIEIITTQNVVLQYELATLRDRGLAFLVDLAVLLVSLSIFSAIGFAALGETETGSTVVAVLLTCIFIFYSLVFESLTKGQSLGKMALRIKVIKIAGGQATFSDYAGRWAFRMIDIYFSLGSVASILIMSSAKGQRIGDIVANTAVVKLETRLNLDLQSLLAIHKQDYAPLYPQARKLKEEEALLIKSALDRYRKYGNDAHEEVLELLARRVQTVLDISNPSANHEHFLRSVLQDYVVLTR